MAQRSKIPKKEAPKIPRKTDKKHKEKYAEECAVGRITKEKIHCIRNAQSLMQYIYTSHLCSAYAEQSRLYWRHIKQK